MSKKPKTGRGALVRRLRREYGLSEADARRAATGSDPDIAAAQVVDMGRSRSDELRKEPITTDYLGWRSRFCHQRPAGWCAPDVARPAQPWGPEHNGGPRTAIALASMAQMARA